MHSRGWGRVSSNRMGQAGHLLRRPQGIWPVGSWDMTATWLRSRLRALLPSCGTLGNIARQQVQMSISLLDGAPRHIPVLPPISSSSFVLGRGVVHPLPSDPHPLPSCSELASPVGSGSNSASSPASTQRAERAHPRTQPATSAPEPCWRRPARGSS